MNGFEQTDGNVVRFPREERREPMVAALEAALRDRWASVVDEPVPEHFLALLVRRPAIEGSAVPGKKVVISDKVWSGLTLLIAQSGRDLHALAEEAFRDLLAKHDRPVDLKDQLARSLERDGPADIPGRTSES